MKIIALEEHFILPREEQNLPPGAHRGNDREKLLGFDVVAELLNLGATRLAAMDVAEPVVTDLGTGSGAIALAIAQEVPRARVHAVEADPLARQWTERNIAATAAAAPHTAGRVTLHAGDFATALAELDGTVDLVISNPPYIPVGSWVPPEVGEYDPATALWSGADGLGAVRMVESVARRLLRPGGLVAVEHGAQQGPAVYWVFAEESGWRQTRNHADLAGRDRFVTAVWPAPG